MSPQHPRRSPDRNPAPRSRKPTMADVAAEVGVSRALVSLVFRGQPGASPDTRERVFDAPRSLVWQAFTDPKLVAQWWGRGNKLVVERLEVERGGHWRFVEHAPDGVHGFEGRFREVTGRLPGQRPGPPPDGLPILDVLPADAAGPTPGPAEIDEGKEAQRPGHT